MGHPFKTVFPCLLSVIAAATFTRCTSLNDPDHSGTATETENVAIAGIIYQPDGVTPAAEVRVAIRPRNTLADTSGFGLSKRMADTATVMTDDSGRFVFDSRLDTGIYVIEAISGNYAVLIDSVNVQDPDSTVYLPPDTLLPAGALKGVIRLSEGVDPRKVFVLAFGIDRFALVDSLGRFRFEGLAEAGYDLRLISSLDDYGVLDLRAVPVASADTTDLDTIVLPYTGIAVPQGLTIDYDTLKQLVYLSWNVPTTGRAVKGYNVYRKHQDSTTSVWIAGLIVDTFYVDSATLQGQAYEYKVAAVDSQDTEGTKSGAASAVITSAFLFVRSITLPDSGSSTYNEPGEMAFDLSGNLYVIDLLGNIHKYDAQGIFIGTWSTGANEARDIEVLGDSVFVLDRAKKEMIVFNTSGTAQGLWSIDSTSDPMNFAVKHEVFYFVDKQSNQILKYSLAGDSIGEWSGGGNNSFKSLKCIATNPISDYLYVLDSDSVGFVFDTTGSLVSLFTIPHALSLAAYTQWFLLHDNNLIYGGKNNFKILVIDLTGKLFAQFGRYGSGQGEFKCPYSIAEAHDNMVYVADKQNSRIQVFRR